MHNYSLVLLIDLTSHKCLQCGVCVLIVIYRIFAEYYPEDVEWINDSKCNVVWPENIRAARVRYVIVLML